MGLYKELNYALEELAGQQSYCSFSPTSRGIVVTDKNDPRCISTANLFRMEHFIGGLKQHRSEDRTQKYVNVKIVVHIPWEHDEGRTICSTWTVSFYREHATGKCCLYFEVKRTAQNDRDIWQS